jgi:isopenicillin N synthase-like dioxygenase
VPDRAPLTIPTIDVAPAVEGHDLDTVAAQLGAVARSVGFVQVVGHGIDPALFDAVHDGADRLWTMDDDALRAMRSPTGHPFRGVDLGVDEHGDRIWQRLQNVRIDTAEEAAAVGVDPAHLDFFGGNVHPPVPGLRDAIDACSAEGRRLGMLLVSLFAIDLGLTPDALSRWFENDVSYFAVQDYPPMGHAAPGAMRIPEHSDSGAVTLLHQRGGYEGLQVRAVDGRRTTVPVVEGALVVNTGDLMARWTNDLYPATPHAVIDGPVGEGRATIAMHLLPGVDTVIAPLPGLVGDDEPRYPPVSMYDWDRRYFEKRSLVLSLADEA